MTDYILTVNLILNFHNVLIPTPGEYRAYVVVDDGALVADVMLNARRVGQGLYN
jgi:hypothetical protein